MSELQRTESGAYIMDGIAPTSTPPPAAPPAPTDPTFTPTSTETPAPPLGASGFVKAEPPAPATPPEWFEQAKTSLGVETYEDLMTRVKTPAQTKQEQPAFGDDYIKNAVDYYKEHGTLKPYLEAFSVDYKTMSPEELVRRDLRREYSDLSDSAFERLHKEQVLDKYKINAEEHDEETVQYGMEMLKRDAEKIRAKLLDEQQKFVPPAREDVQAKLAEQTQKWERYVKENPDVKRLLETKNITIDVNGESYNYGIDTPEEIVGMAIDNSKFWSLFADRDGNVNMQAFTEVAAFAKNRDQYRQSLISLGQTFGTQDVKRELKNGEMPRSTVQQPGGMTGDWREQFLDAALNAKRK